MESWYGDSLIMLVLVSRNTILVSNGRYSAWIISWICSWSIINVRCKVNKQQTATLDHKWKFTMDVPAGSINEKMKYRHVLYP